jgi:hypothetical protein
MGESPCFGFFHRANRDRPRDTQSLEEAVLSLPLHQMAHRRSSANGPSLGLQKERQHDANITIL